MPSERPIRSAAADAAGLFDDLRDAYRLSDRWAGSRFEWAKRLLPAQKGRAGEQLFDQLCAAAAVTVDGRNATGYDRSAAGRKVEVKFSTLYDTTDPAQASFKWLQLRPADDYDLVVLIGVEPDTVRVWVVSKVAVLAASSGQHGGKDATETRMVEVHPDELPAWLGPDVGDDPEAFAARLRDV